LVLVKRIEMGAETKAVADALVYGKKEHLLNLNADALNVSAPNAACLYPINRGCNVLN